MQAWSDSNHWKRWRCDFVKPIIVNMKDMSDSTEVYEARPNPFLVYFIYVILAMIGVAFVWMYFSKIDIVVKSNGIFKGNTSVYEISSEVTGQIVECDVRNGQYVEEGDILYIVEVTSLDETIKFYQSELDNVNDRLEILYAYEKSLGGERDALLQMKENPYYQEFLNKEQLLYANINANSNNTEEISAYQGNVDAINASIAQYEVKKSKLEQVKSCIASRINAFGADDTYYYSTVNSYLSNYNYTAGQYDTEISEYQKMLIEYDAVLNEEIIATEETESETTESDVQEEIDSDASVEPVSATGNMVSKEEIQKQIATLQSEKQQVLSSLESQQIASVQQQIESINDTMVSLKSSLASAKLQLETAQNSEIEDIYILTESSNVAAEILTYESKRDECENYLKSYDVQNNNCNIKANMSGYFYLQEDVKTGMYIQEGTSIGKIYPEKNTKYYAELYVDNADVAKLEVGQAVKFEIAAYPSSEYGYFTGKVVSIPKDITIDQRSGSAYYLVEVECDSMFVKNENGDEATLMNGMACQARIVVDEENVLKYLLRKIDLLD